MEYLISLSCLQGAVLMRLICLLITRQISLLIMLGVCITQKKVK